ncbi:MAG: hypothetical protein F6K30_15235 [Cyanothece sp. SIO2G6]|nr:hypothetical protein [Cyanothece sp. SIO2G6]
MIPAAVVCLLLFGPRFWRQVCPLAWIVQLPRIFGLKANRQHQISRTGWLATQFPYITFGLFFLGLNIRLLFVNSDRLGLGLALLFISLAALTSGVWFGGRTWCQYFCPMIGVEMLYMGVEGALGNPLISKSSRFSTNLCQTVDRRGKHKSACVGCSLPCIDLQPDKLYWQQILQPGLKWLYYGYVGLVVGFFGYLFLYSGNHQFLASGAMWLETHQLSTLFQPGLYLLDRAIHIPKVVAVPLTLGVSAGLGYITGCFLESQYKQLPRRRPFPQLALQHHCFSICTFISFNLLFFMGVRPSLGWLPSILLEGTSWGLVCVATMWLCRALLRTVPEKV